MVNFIDLTGHVYGRLTVIERCSPSGPTTWICACECGRKHTVSGWYLRKGSLPLCDCETESQENDEWKDIVGYEGLYQISRDGEVKSLPRLIPWKENGVRTSIKEKMLSLSAGSHGYIGCTLSKNGIETTLLIHHLVAQSFIGPRPPMHDVHHKDKNKRNNSYSNLEYKLESKHHSEHSVGRIGPNRKLTNDQVLEIFNLAWQESMTQTEIGNMFSVGFRMVSGIKNRAKFARITESIIRKGKE